MSSTSGGIRRPSRSLETSKVSRRHDLVFAGLDTLATVWLNGVEVGRSANMLIEHRFDVTDALRPGTNRIVVRLGSAVNHARQFSYDAASMSWEHREEGLFIRKAPHVWGWDIMPRAVSAGIWRSVWIEERPATAIEQLYYWTAGVNAEGATLGVRFQFRTDAATTDGFWLRFQGRVRTTTPSTYDWPLEFIAGGCRIPVPDARLWWPKGYGEPNLYTVTAQLVKDGQVVAERTDRIGIRTSSWIAPRPRARRGRRRRRMAACAAWMRRPIPPATSSSASTMCRSWSRDRTGCRSTRSTAATPSAWIGPWRSSPTWAAT